MWVVFRSLRGSQISAHETLRMNRDHLNPHFDTILLVFIDFRGFGTSKMKTYFFGGQKHHPNEVGGHINEFHSRRVDLGPTPQPVRLL